MTTTTNTNNKLDLRDKTTAELVDLLKTLPSHEWNAAYREATADGDWRANLVGADLVGANLVGANLVGADLVGANLGGANLVGADLGGARLGDDTLTGRVAWIGEAAGYPVLMLATETGHVLRAGCWTGVLDDAVARALEERDDEVTRVEADAVVAHGRAILAAWGEVAS